MRVTENTNFETIRDSIRRSKERMEKLQGESATLKKLNTPSDDPVAAMKVLEVRTEKVNNDQFQVNAKMAQTFLENSDHVLSNLADIALRAKEIAIGQSSGASANAQTRLGVAEEVTQLYKQAVMEANTRVGDRYLFGGYHTDKPPVDADGNYHGDDGQMMVEVAKGVYVSMNIPGAEVFNTSPPKPGSSEPATYGQGRGPASQKTGEEAAQEGATQPENVNLFDELQNLRISLLSSDTVGIQDTLDAFDQIHSKLIATRSKIGSRIQGLDATSQAIDRHNITNAGLTSQLEDADMAQVVSDMGKEESVFKSALQSSQKLIQPTLMDFLK